MKINQITIVEEKKRLDPKCWTGYKKQGTKMKGGVRVNNCVPANEAANAKQQAAIAISKKDELAEGENWSKHNNPRAGGMSQKSVKSYRRSHPGSKIQTAVTTKPSKLKKGSKSAKRRASFCARMRGMKKHRTGAKTARDPNSNINKSLRRWHCESVQELKQLVMIAEQKISKLKEAGNPAQQAQQAGNAIRQFTPQLMRGVSNDVRRFRGQDPTKDPEYARLSPQQQQQYLQAQQTINSANPDELEKFDANQAASNIQGMAKSVVNPNNMPNATLKPTQYTNGVAPSARKTAADYPPATAGGNPAATPTAAPTTPTPGDEIEEESKGLWANIHAKQKRIKNGSGEHMRKPGSKGAPTAQSFKDSVSKKKHNESVELNELVSNDQWYIVMRGNLDFHGKYHGKGDDVTGPIPKVQASTELHKTHPYDSNWTIVPASSMQKQIHENSSPQAAAAKKALNRGSKKMPGMSNIVQQLVHEIKPDGTVVVKNSSETKTMNNIKKILELGGGKNFDVVMAPPGPGWHSVKPVPIPDEPNDKKEVAEVKDDEDDGLIGGLYTPEQWAKMIANLKRKAQEQDAKNKQQEKPKDLGESTVELNNLLRLSGNNK